MARTSLRVWAAVSLHELIVDASQNGQAIPPYDDGSWAGRGICGIATNMLDYNDAAMNSFCNSGLDFWWNWAHAPRNIYSETCSFKKFVPMIWGWAPNNDNARIARSGAAYMMGYNEPDLWGPPPNGWPGDYLASGSFPQTFQCGKPTLAQDWQHLVMSYLATNPDGIVLSPSMADPERGAASAGNFAECNNSPQTDVQHMPWCPGWLKCFRDSVIQLQCGKTNCWDVISILQFHAYVYTAEDLIEKIQAWERVWSDDLKAINGRSRKTLWLTEFSRAGTTDPNDPDGKAREFMEKSIAYLHRSEFVSGWSWFSQDNTTFASFAIGDKQPDTKFWASDLIDASGKMTVIGEKYASLCRTDKAAGLV